MEEFFITYKPNIIWGLIVITVVIILRLITNLIYKWICKKEHAQFLEDTSTQFRLVKKVFNLLWIILGIIALSFSFLDKDKYAMIKTNFNIVLYLGILTVITITVASSVNLWFKRSVRERLLLKEDPTAYRFLKNIAVFATYFLGVLFGLLAFPSLKGVAQTALGGAGVLALIAGVASQEALSNLVGGVFIIAFKPFIIGDIVKVNDTMVGTVVDITLRHCVIRNFQNMMIVIPNSVINKEKLINYNLGNPKTCEYIEMGISYDSDVTLAKKIMQEECEKHSLIIDYRTQLEKKNDNPVVRTALTKINESTMTVRAWAWTKNYDDAFTLRCDVNETIKSRFDEAGIDLAFPTRTIVIEPPSKDQLLESKE